MLSTKKRLLKKLSRKEMEAKVRKQEQQIDTLFSKLKEMKDYNHYLENNLVSIRDAAKRDYIVRTKYLGKLKDKNIIKDFKKEVEKIIRYSFEEACNFIRDYRFIVTRVGGMMQAGEEPPRIYILEEFSFILERYENRQVVLDNYTKKEGTHND